MRRIRAGWELTKKSTRGGSFEAIRTAEPTAPAQAQAAAAMAS
jgi:hypothetical protein